MKEASFSLGWEFEATRSAYHRPAGVDVGSDGSVNNEGVEYRLDDPGLIQNPIRGMQTLRELVLDRHMEIDDSCGYHVHLALKDFRGMVPNLPKLWAAWCVTLAKEIEDKVMEAVPPSRRNNRYCLRWKGVTIDSGILGQSYSSDKTSNRHRYHWLNVTEVFRHHGIGTVEFRLMGESKSFPYLFAWSAFCVLFAKAAFRLIEDPSRLDYEAVQLERMLGMMRGYFQTRPRTVSPASCYHEIKMMGVDAGLISNELIRGAADTLHDYLIPSARPLTLTHPELVAPSVRFEPGLVYRDGWQQSARERENARHRRLHHTPTDSNFMPLPSPQPYCRCNDCRAYRRGEDRVAVVPVPSTNDPQGEHAGERLRRIEAEAAQAQRNLASRMERMAAIVNGSSTTPYEDPEAE